LKECEACPSGFRGPIGPIVVRMYRWYEEKKDVEKGMIKLYKD